MNLNDTLKALASKGCRPSIYRRGNMWRAHINIAGNFWSDGSTPLQALMDAEALWRAKNCPKEG